LLFDITASGVPLLDRRIAETDTPLSPMLHEWIRSATLPRITLCIRCTSITVKKPSDPT